MLVLVWFAVESAPHAVFLPVVRPKMRCRRWCADTASGQGLRLSLRGSGAQRDCARSCADTASGQGLLLSLGGPGAQRDCARWCADTSIWARIALVSPWSWCSARLRALVCGYIYMGKDCACLFVVLVPVGSAAHTCVRIRLLGKDCACLSVVLVLSAIARVGCGYVCIGRDCACLFVILALVCQGCSHARCGARQMPGIDVQKTAEPRSCSSSIRSRRLCLTIETGTHSATVHSSAAWLVSPGQLRCSFWGPAHRCRAEGAVSTGTRPP